ncbi:hypothetical protein GQ43DRAFT_444857, partial [Delitschia confertaspora ATCC 74209]
MNRLSFPFLLLLHGISRTARTTPYCKPTVPLASDALQFLVNRYANSSFAVTARQSTLALSLQSLRNATTSSTWPTAITPPRSRPRPRPLPPSPNPHFSVILTATVLPHAPLTSQIHRPKIRGSEALLHFDFRSV